MSNPMTPAERRAVATLAGVFSLRLFGLFLIMPVFVFYAQTLAGNTEFWMGVALGAYGLTQALFQIPYGLASDRFGRKPMIALGLVVFAAGSVLAAVSSSIYGVIAGRALQGAGAIAAVVLALAADLTREEQRTKAMGLIGVTIGATFLVSLVAGPLLAGWIGVRGIFWMTAALAALGVLVLAALVPTPVRAAARREVRPVPAQFAEVLRDAALVRLDIGILVLHFILTALFVAVPFVLAREAGLAADAHWKVYLPVIALSVLGMAPLVFFSTRSRLIRPIFAAAVALLAAGQAMLYVLHWEFTWVVAALWVFFVGFNLLEVLLPSLVSRLAPAASKGTAIGVYNSFEFFGVFLGGAAGGYVLGLFGPQGVFALCTLLAALWLVVVLAGPAPKLLDTRLIRVGPCDAVQARALAERLAAVRGVVEAIVIAEEGVAYLKVNPDILDAAALDEFAATTG